MKNIFVFLFTIFPFFLFAQLPKTEIYLFDIKKDRQGYKLENPIKIKVGDGYNNQPWFTQDGEYIYFVSNGKKQGKTDIYRYQLSNGKIKQITRTRNAAEYSPQIAPDGEHISCIRVPKDTNIQNMVLYNLKGKRPHILFGRDTTFGYYCWKSQIELFSFHVPEPFSFKYHHSIRGESETFYPAIGRCIKNTRGKITYVDKSDSNAWKIKILNPKRYSTRKYNVIEEDEILSNTLVGEEDYDFLRGSTLLMGQGGVIYQKEKVFDNPKAEWQALFDLNPFHITKFYRIAISPSATKLVVVSYAGTHP